MKCYQGSGNSAVVSSCTGTPAPDRCTKEINSGVVTYACGVAADLNINGSVADNACSTTNNVKKCLCSTDECNTIGNCYPFKDYDFNDVLQTW